MMPPKLAASIILAQRLKIDEARRIITKTVKEQVPDYHFLDDSISTFWTCPTSPFGYCLFRIREIGGRVRTAECRFCGGLEERK